MEQESRRDLSDTVVVLLTGNIELNRVSSPTVLSSFFSYSPVYLLNKVTCHDGFVCGV